MTPELDDPPTSHDDLETKGDEGEVFDLDPLIRDNEEECSGGETRTHNLMGPDRLAEGKLVPSHSVGSTPATRALSPIARACPTGR